MANEIKGGDTAKVIEVSTEQLTEHSKQAEYSPQMSKKKWREFLAGIAKEGILQPIVVTKGFRVIDGKHRLKAAKELDIEYVRVIIEDIPEDDIPAYITETKLNRDDLKSGQKAALVIRLFYEEERQKAKERMSEGGTIGNDIRWNGSGTPNLERAIEVTGETAEILRTKAGVGKSNMYYLLAVYRNRPDLFERVFNGEYSINKAYTQMKADEEPVLFPEYFRLFPDNIRRGALARAYAGNSTLQSIGAIVSLFTNGGHRTDTNRVRSTLSTDCIIRCISDSRRKSDKPRRYHVLLLRQFTIM